MHWPASILVSTNARSTMHLGHPDDEEAACKKYTKRKGGPMIADSRKGILLANHSGKALTGMVKEKIGPEYVEKMPSTQFGAIPKRGTDQASHIVRSAADAVMMLTYSIVVLFLDLVKAFDRVIRELVFGWGAQPQGTKQPSPQLGAYRTVPLHGPSTTSTSTATYWHNRKSTKVQQSWRSHYTLVPGSVQRTSRR